MTMTQNAATATHKVAGRADWLHFPYRQLVSARLQGVTARAVWVAIPLEYYVLTRFSGGLRPGDAVAVVLVALLVVLGVLAISVAVAAFGARDRFSARVQGWSVSLIVNWVTTLFLLSLGYLVSPTPNDDIVHKYLSEDLQIDIGWGGYPRIFDLQTFLVYLIYAVAAFILISIAARKFVGTVENDDTKGPNVVGLIFLTAALTMVAHGAARVY